MSKLLRQIAGKLSGWIGTYYFIEVEEKATAFGQIGLRKYRIIVRAMSTRSAISAASRYCLQLKQRDSKEYELSFINKI